jgi:hypothetical protein
MKAYIFTISFVMALLSQGQLVAQSAKVHGTLLDQGDPMPLQSVLLRANGTILRRSMTDGQGKFEFALLEAGSYTLEVTDGDLYYRFTVNLAPNETEPCKLDIEKAAVFDAMGERIYKMESERIYAPEDGELQEVFTLDPIGTDIVPRNEIERIAGPRGVESAISMAGPGFYQPDQGSPLNISGARDYGTAIYVDGVKVRGDFDVSQACINQVAFMNNGIPAAYGDLTGGVVVITTYNPGMKGSPGRPVKPLKTNSKKARKHQSMTPASERVNWVCL